MTTKNENNGSVSENNNGDEDDVYEEITDKPRLTQPEQFQRIIHRYPEQLKHSIVVCSRKFPDYSMKEEEEEEYISSIQIEWEPCRRGASPLERLDLYFHSFWASFDRLETLHLWRFPYQTFASNSLGRLVHLKSLKISEAKYLEELPLQEFQTLNSLRSLVLEQCPLLQDLPDDFGTTANFSETLHELKICACDAFHYLPECILNGQLNRLKQLELQYLYHLESLPEISPSSSPSLQVLSVTTCTRLQTLPASIGTMQQLQTLILIGNGRKFIRIINTQVPNAIKRCKSLRTVVFRRLKKETILGLFAEPWDDYPDGNRESSTDGETITTNQIRSHSLETLRLQECNLDQEAFLQCLPNFPKSIQRLDLSGNSVHTLSGIAGDGLLSSSLPPRIQELILTNNPVLKADEQNDREVLLQLLELYPYLGAIGWSGGSIFTPMIHYKLLWNRCGRALISFPNMLYHENIAYFDAGTTKTIPPLPSYNDSVIQQSLWPLILEQVKDKVLDQLRGYLFGNLFSDAPDQITEESMEASIVYALLHGPALLKR